MKKTNTDENVLYMIGWIMISLLVVIAAVSGICPELLKKYLSSCPIRVLTGLYCPGCGGTRAVVSLLKGRIFKSLLYHPFVPFVTVIGSWFMISHTIERLSGGRLAIGMKYRAWYLWVALALVGLNFLVKNFLLLLGIDVPAMLG